MAPPGREFSVPSKNAQRNNRRRSITTGAIILWDTKLIKKKPIMRDGQRLHTAILSCRGALKSSLNHRANNTHSRDKPAARHSDSSYISGVQRQRSGAGK
ncbi:hypothetical protein Sant_2062 [Sodalis praecaptivus]|uniref:Uncharacterized protein n=1 Tax=Sodalis praecaptivus TaxID=1239307 RepID=W0HY28_9GAMM|nr:hypothetical protein Sant_2062 [Sodalis praecaptivus]